MAWSEKDLENLKAKGLQVDEQIFRRTPAIQNTPAAIAKSKKSKISTSWKVSEEKRTIEFILISFKQKGLISDFVTEHKFDTVRRFRFDWAIIDQKIAIEYEGVFSEKSRHTSLNGFSEDCVKYNLAIANGWRVLRYTAMNYQNLESDLIELLK